MENFELDSEQKEIKQKIFPYLKALTYEIVKNQPKQLEQFMIDFLTKQGNYTTSGLTKEEKKELELLRITVKHYRDMEKHNLASSQAEMDIDIKTPSISDNSYSEEEDNDVMDEKEEEKVNEKLSNIRKAQEGRARVSVSAEAYGLYNKKQSFVPKIIPKNEDQMNRIKGKIISSFIFSSLEKKDLEVVINAMEEKKFKLNENVITQGEDGDCLYIVETGILKCFKTFNPESTPKYLRDYESGDSFGELALLYNCPRAATIVCSSDECILWSLDRETFNHIVKDAAQKKREKYENFLKNVDILSTIDSYELGQICDSLKDGIYKKDEYIIREGELGDVFYIIEEGKCIATKTLEPGKPETVINELKEGDYFGERALIRGEPRYANIVVASDTAKVISLDRPSFNRLLGPILDILKRNIDKYQVYCVNNKDNENNNISNSNANSNQNLNNLDNIITSGNINNINNISIPNENNPIDLNKNDLNNNIDNENAKINNYTNIDENNNLNSIITAPVNDNLNNNNNEINNENEEKENNDDNNVNDENNDIGNSNENNNGNIIMENEQNNNNNLTSLNDMLTPNNDSQNINNNDGQIKEEIVKNENNDNENNISIEDNSTPIDNNKNQDNNTKEEEAVNLPSLENMLQYNN